MRSTLGWPLVLSLALLLSVSGCSWESGGSDKDAGDDDDGSSGGEQDIDLTYPPGPYGTDYGDTAENFEIEKITCTGGTGTGSPFALEEFLGAKAVLVIAHSGTCQYCKQQASSLERDIQQKYGWRGLKIVLVMIGDDNDSIVRQSVLNYACEYKNLYGFTFTVAIDPGAEKLGRYFEGVPLNMLLDSDMVIRYRLEGLIPNSNILEGNIEGLLGE